MSPRLDARLAGDLWFFRVTVEAGGFSRAADHLAVTQSAVTQRIQRLEQRLGGPLIVRGGRDLQLTAAGRDLYEAARAGFDGIDAALRRTRRDGERAVLRVSCVPSLASEWLAPRLRDFCDAHPGIDVAIFAEMHDLDRPRMALEGIDVAIRYGPAPPPGATVAFDHPEDVFPVCSPSYAAARAADDASPVVLLHDARPWTAASVATAEWSLWLRAHGPPWGRRTQDLYFNFAQLAFRASAGGSGVALGRALVVASYLADGRLVEACGGARMAGLRYFVLVRELPLAGPAAMFAAWLGRSMAEAVACDAGPASP